MFTRLLGTTKPQNVVMTGKKMPVMKKKILSLVLLLYFGHFLTVYCNIVVQRQCDAKFEHSLNHQKLATCSVLVSWTSSHRTNQK